ncbi:hypothetical protein [Pseudarthrobacter sp. BIM B-2242]|uniref:hypothetical protein n=1 Tax=Pseudarthrobacter sp. BIM B-2242 TaxID=2772401 RepID=UPI00168A9CBE|nr:hypothetical protein [Pseudarthrobacter sp. BIM B-2242]QOD06061.1 hypothetical protein IDT60_21090 [Pseudarthrobacter sp. BIM B-2242]
MATYTAMPPVLEQQVSAIVREISSPQPSASNTVFVIREALAQAYAAGHRDGHTLAHSLEWVTKDLDTVYKDRAAASKAATRDAATEPSS